MQSIGSIIRPSATVLMLLTATALLAILILCLVMYVGRRPDPRVAASADRLRSTVSW